MCIRDRDDYGMIDGIINNGAKEPTVAELEQQGETHESPGFITELYAPKNPDSITPEDRVFYTRRNAVYLDTCLLYTSRCV